MVLRRFILRRQLDLELRKPDIYKVAGRQPQKDAGSQRYPAPPLQSLLLTLLLEVSTASRQHHLSCRLNFAGVIL
jgi:hypothetical protein